MDLVQPIDVDYMDIKTHLLNIAVPPKSKEGQQITSAIKAAQRLKIFDCVVALAYGGAHMHERIYTNTLDIKGLPTLIAKYEYKNQKATLLTVDGKQVTKLFEGYLDGSVFCFRKGPWVKPIVEIGATALVGFDGAKSIISYFKKLRQLEDFSPIEFGPEPDPEIDLMIGRCIAYAAKGYFLTNPITGEGKYEKHLKITGYDGSVNHVVEHFPEKGVRIFGENNKIVFQVFAEDEEPIFEMGQWYWELIKQTPEVKAIAEDEQTDSQEI